MEMRVEGETKRQMEGRKFERWSGIELREEGTGTQLLNLTSQGSSHRRRSLLTRSSSYGIISPFFNLNISVAYPHPHTKNLKSHIHPYRAQMNE